MDAETIEHKCTTCGKVLSSAGYLKNHIRLSHPALASNERGPTDMAETKAMADVKPTNSQPEDTTAPAQPASLTPDERALVDQITRSKGDWDTITEESMTDFSLAQDWGKLPPEAQDRQDRKEFAFRWCERTPKRVAELTNASAPLKWWVANRVTAPYLSKYVDPTVGGILRLDQILLLKPWKLHQLVKDAVASSAKAMYDSRELNKGGAQKIQSRDSSDHLKVIAGERAHVKGGDMMFDGESGAEVGDLVAAD
jgi:hypothetical protein